MMRINDSVRRNGRARRGIMTLGGLAVALLTAASSIGAHHRAAQEPAALRGSKESVEKMYEFARRNGYPFYLTPTTLDDAIARGKLVPLPGDSTYEITRGVGFS